MSLSEREVGLDVVDPQLATFRFMATLQSSLFIFSDIFLVFCVDTVDVQVS
jgi:hypothetical protein